MASGPDVITVLLLLPANTYIYHILNEDNKEVRTYTEGKV